MTAFRFLVKHNKASSSTRSDRSSTVYHWQRLSFATWQSAGASVLFCFALGSDMEQRMRQSLLAKKKPIRGDSPFSLHPFVLMHVVENLDEAIWSWRDTVRNAERNRPSSDHDATENFADMHEVARHLIHCSEMLTTALSVIEDIIKECESGLQGSHNVDFLTTRRDLHFVVSTLKGFLHRSRTLEGRMQNEINLISHMERCNIQFSDFWGNNCSWERQAFHTNAQRDTVTANRIAEAAQRDGQITKGISILGMLFLPGTFVSVGHNPACQPPCSTYLISLLGNLQHELLPLYHGSGRSTGPVDCLFKNVDILGCNNTSDNARLSRVARVAKAICSINKFYTKERMG